MTRLQPIVHLRRSVTVGTAAVVLQSVSVARAVCAIRSVERPRAF
jgi:hypothetical protein